MPLNTSLTFSQNVTSLEVTLEVIADSVVEEDKVLLAELVVPEGESGMSLRSSRVAITIINDDSNANIHETAGVCNLTLDARSSQHSGTKKASGAKLICKN